MRVPRETVRYLFASLSNSCPRASTCNSTRGAEPGRRHRRRKTDDVLSISEMAYNLANLFTSPATCEAFWNEVALQTGQALGGGTYQPDPRYKAFVVNNIRNIAVRDVLPVVPFGTHFSARNASCLTMAHKVAPRYLVTRRERRSLSMCSRRC